MPKATVTHIAEIAPGIRQIRLQPDAGMSSEFPAGGHLDLSLPNGLVRSYSLVPCQTPQQFEIAVFKEPTSRGGSDYLHTQLALGDQLVISEPKTTFRPVQAETSVFFAAGIGVTPLISLADQAWAQGQSLRFHYSVRAQSQAAYLDLLASRPWATAVQLHDASCGERLDLAEVLGSVPTEAAIYACGPSRYLSALEQLLDARGSREQLFVERFRQDELQTGGGSFVVECAQSGVTVEVGEDETILAALERSGIDVPYACEEGICGTCVTAVLDGQVDHRDTFLTPEEQSSQTLIAVCCSRAVSDRLVLDL